MGCFTHRSCLISMECMRDGRLATPWTGAYQAPPSMGFSRQEYWSGVPLPSLTLEITKKNKAKSLFSMVSQS